MEKHYVYITTNLKTNKKYVGKRSCKCEICDDDYLGSGKELKSDIEKYGYGNFQKDVIAIFKTNELAFEYEEFTICKLDAINRDDYYNIVKGGGGCRTYSRIKNNIDKDRTFKVNYSLIKKERISKCIRPEDIATLLGISSRTYYNRENGNYQFKLNELYIISEILDLKIDQIVLNE